MLRVFSCVFIAFSLRHSFCAFVLLPLRVRVTCSRLRSRFVSRARTWRRDSETDVRFAFVCPYSSFIVIVFRVGVLTSHAQAVLDRKRAQRGGGTVRGRGRGGATRGSLLLLCSLLLRCLPCLLIVFELCCVVIDVLHVDRSRRNTWQRNNSRWKSSM